MAFNLEMLEIDPDAARQYIDARAAFVELERTRKRVTFAHKLAQDAPSMLAALQKVNKSFQVNEEQKYTAINKDGFEVDIIRRIAKEGEIPIRSD